MANYKKLTDVEVMEEVSENSMALVNENGVLKQVPCGAGFGGGGNTAVIEFTSSGGSDVAPMIAGSGIDDGMQFICNNMTHSDVASSLQNGVFVNVVAIGYDGDYLTQGIANVVSLIPEDDMICMYFDYMPFTELYWYSDNTISTERPSAPAPA